MPNRLAGETSPYLLQHRDNPVDWYPWGEEAFARARAEDRPILLSVGYSSCHWCHVMAHESFEDPEIAALMNQWFVNVKVDREERPDVDAIYMTATQALTGQGGWPMTVFLTPDLVPFFAGTYYPPRDSGGRVGFPRLLQSIHQAWQDDRAGILESARQIGEHLRSIEARLVPAPGIPGLADASRALARLQPLFDQVWGGFGGAPKFPSPSTHEALLAAAARLPGQDPADPRTPLGMVAITLDRMATGGMADHLGGGFARYAVDARWLVPHFEKMLYDNAQLARLYLHGWQVTGRDAWKAVTTATLDYLLRDLRDAAGGFWSAQDADSEGVEGLYYTWTPAEIRAVLEDDAAFALEAWGVEDEGNFLDPHHPEVGRRSVLHRWADLDAVGTRHGLDPDAARRMLERCRQRLLDARYQRVPPGLDDKVLTSWNGLALAAFAEAGRVLRRPDYRDAALANARFVREQLWDPERRVLRHTWKAGEARIDGMLEDYTFYGLGLVELFAATGDRTWLDWARELLEIATRHFHDPAGGGFYDAAAAPDLIVRQKPTFDGPTPSGNAAAGLLAWWIGRYYEDAAGLGLADEVLRLMAERMIGVPNGFGAAWLLAELRLAPERELAIVGPDALRGPFEAAVARAWVPGLVIAPAREPGGLPVLEGRVPPGDAAVAAWLCEARVCQLPATAPQLLADQLAALRPAG